MEELLPKFPNDLLPEHNIPDMRKSIAVKLTTSRKSLWSKLADTDWLIELVDQSVKQKLGQGQNQV
jgi:glutaredoxin 2